MYLWKRSVIAKAIFAFSFLTASAFAQTTTGRLPKTIEGYNAVQIQGTVSPRAATKYDTGRVNAGTRLDGVTMYFKPTVAQQTDLNLLLREQQTPGSAEYHRWLTPAQFASRFGLSTSDIATVKTWLEQQGFTVERVANSRTSVTFSGSVSQIESAFQTELHNYTQNGVTHFANSTPVSVPSALSGVVRSVRNLDNFKPQAHVRIHNGSVQSNFTSSVSPGDHYMTPGDVATIYDVSAAYNAGYTGSGQSIAVMGQSAVDLSDIEAFQTAIGMTVKDPTVVLVPSTGSAETVSGDEAESDIDLEYSSSVAKGANIYFVYTGNSQNNEGVFDSISYAVDTDIAPILSMSYGECEADLGQGNYATLDAVLQQAATQGQSVIVSSGDSGSTACYVDVQNNKNGVGPTADQEALAVNYPASSAYVTAMGGTEFPSADVASTNSTYWESASGSDVIASAVSYIPEQVWNDDSAQYGAEYGAYYALSAGGGGTSQFATRPSWQSGVTGIPSGKYRLVPDISLDSSPNNAGYLYCTSDTSSWSSGQKASCNSGFRDSSSQILTVAGGTSFAAPIFAGMLAVINQKTNSTGQGLINSTLYSLAADATTYASAFHDITSGGNQCNIGTTYCSTDGAANYAATTGYDEASGLGSIDLNNLMDSWPTTTASALESTVTSLNAASADPASGASDVITISVTPSSSSLTTTPTGTLTIKVDGTTESSTLDLSSGSATYTFSSTTAGSHVIVATYSGDSTFAASTGTVTVDVGGSSGSSSGGSITVTAANVSVAAGSSGSSTVTVTSANSYAGTVGFTLSTDSTSLQNYGCYDISNLPVTANATATTTLTIYTSESTCNATASKASNHRHNFARAGGKSAKISAATPPWRTALRISSAFGVAGICFLGFGKRRRNLWTVVAFLAVTGLLGLASGCGSNGNSSSSTTSSTNVSAGSYTLTLDAADSTDSSIAASTTFTLTVTQ